MVFFNYATMQMAAKIVYYGPGLCGKTTNLHHIYTKTSPQSRGEMVSLETETDRTLFFDLLPIDVGVIGGFKTRLQLYTVPGQVFYNTTRKLVLKGVDGIVFVADSQRAMLEANVESFKNLRENLAEIGSNVDEIPLVFQLNKRDLPNIADVQTMLDALDPERRAEHVEAIAASGNGVFETLKLISKLTLRTLRRRMTGEDPMRGAAAGSSRGAHFRVQENSRPTPAAVAPSSGSFSTAALAAAAEEELEETLPETLIVEAAPDEVVVVPEPAQPAHTTVETETEAEAEAAEEIPAATEEPEPSTEYVPPPVAAEPAHEPEIEFGQAEKPAKAEPEVKTVKVRSSVDVMAELEALRKRATSTTPRAPKRDILADLENLRPRREIQRTLHLSIPAETLPKAKTVRVTLAFENGDGVLETQSHEVELGETSDVHSLSVNLKIDLT